MATRTLEARFEHMTVNDENDSGDGTKIYSKQQAVASVRTSQLPQSSSRANLFKVALQSQNTNTEIKFGDNDTLSAITAGMVHADMLFLMTDVDCLYDKNPRTHPDAKAIEIVEDISTLEADVSGAGSSLGTGGMMTKIIAARLATSVGVTTIVTRSSNPGNILEIVRYEHAARNILQAANIPNQDDEEGMEEFLAASTASIQLDNLEKPPLHTCFLPSAEPIHDRHFWLLHTLRPNAMRGIKPLTVVLKLGTSSIVDEETHQPLLSILTLIVETAIKLKKDGHRVIIISSGAIGVGLLRMEMDHRPKHLSALQALAAIGQCRLISLWDSLFMHFRQPVAQILLTRNDIADRTRYTNAQNTMNELLGLGVIPIVNENDTIAVSEIKFGDNDTLSAITAGMVHADMLFLMTDVDC
ncbi:hypothetical protein BN1723_017786, partial [Verticillium longisporum]